MLVSVGRNITRFKEVYDIYVKKEEDLISELLWQREPTPLTVRLFYDELVRKIVDSSAIDVAFRILPPTKYYGKMFEYLRHQRPNDAEFLYTLKFAYDFYLQRTFSDLKDFQHRIFGSNSPSEPARVLSTWVYHMAGTYSISDLARDTIKYPEERLNEIITFLSSKYFLDYIIKFTKSKPSPVSYDILSSIGQYLGKNVELLIQGESNRLLPSAILDSLRIGSEEYENFMYGFKDGITGTFRRLHVDLQTKILDVIVDNHRFRSSLSESLGVDFAYLDENLQNRIMEIAEKSAGKSEFSRWFGQGLGLNFNQVKNEKLQMRILKFAERDKYFALEFGKSIGFELMFSDIKALNDRKYLNLISKLAGKQYWFTEGLIKGPGSERDFFFREELREKRVIEIAMKDIHLAYAIGSTLAKHFGKLNKDFQDKILKIAKEKKNKFVNGFGKGLGKDFGSLGMREEIIEIAESNSYFASALAKGGLSDGTFSYMDRNLQERIWKMVEKDKEFAY